MEDKKCITEGKIYDQDSEVCDEKLCYVCKDGIWHKQGTLDFQI